MKKTFLNIFIVVLLSFNVSGSHPRDLAWVGGPVHLECEHTVEALTKSGQYVKENIIATKAAAFKNDIFVLTPRLKHGVLASIWTVVRGRNGVELQAFPSTGHHKQGDCSRIQNAIDFFLDHLGNLWVLDSGIVDTVESPRCTCQPKVVEINLILEKITRSIDLTSLVEPTTMLQTIVVEHIFGGKPFVYISEASRGAIFVCDIVADSKWSVIASGPSQGLQIALVKRGPTHMVLIMARIQHPGILELDTAALRRKNSLAPLRVFGENTKPVVLLGSGRHHVYLRHLACTDVLSWDCRDAYNDSRLVNIHSPGPHLSPTSVGDNHFKHMLLILDSNYAETIHTRSPTYHRITFRGKL